jgi:hypothetical protein
MDNIAIKKYDLPHSWSNALLPTLLANAYQKRMSLAQRLPAHLLVGPIEKRGSADVKEVINIPISSLINWRILRFLKMILCISSLGRPWRVGSPPSWKKHGGRFWLTCKSFIDVPFAWMDNRIYVQKDKRIKSQAQSETISRSVTSIREWTVIRMFLHDL